MSTCVVKDIEFMNTSKRLGVHPDNLELIVHEFINKEGNEGSFPTDSYIKEALSGKPFEASRGAIKLWKRRYSTPKTFRNLAELQRAVSKAEKFFPREAIGTYRTNDNKYVMQVGTPLLKNPTQSRVDQIVTHLRLSGIPVHGRRGMIRYIRENGLDNVQQGANRLYQMFIGKKARANFEQTLRNQRPDMSNEEIKSTLDFLHSLEDNKENTAYIKAAIKWVANRSITLPQDNTKAKQVFSEARKRHIDVMKYNTLGELITSDEMKPKEKEKPKFDPDKAKTFSNKRTVTTEKGRVFTVYDVENNGEGQREVCKALAAHYKFSPWCLSTFTATGEPTQSAKKFWDTYNGVKRRIAYEDGKPVAFSSDQGTTDHENEINNYVDDLVNRLLKDQLSEQEQVNLEKAIDELASSNESKITTTPEYVKEFIDKNPELYKEFEKEWSHVYTINGKENEILKMLLLGYSDSVTNFRLGYKDGAFTLGDSGEFGFTWALCLELPGTSLANKIKGENELSDREAWWDMEDTHSTPELGDFIMNERMLSEQREQEANELGLPETMEDAGLDYDAFDGLDRAPWGADDITLALAESRHQYEEMGIPEHFIDAIEHTGEDEIILGIYRDHPEFTTEDQVTAEFNRRRENYIDQLIDMDLPWFKTPSGEIYGFVTPEGEMYLDTRVINEEHPIHEYTHLWDKAVQDRNPGLWLRGVALMKQIPLWNEIANSNQYGAKWRESGITEDKLTNLIASEVHARLVGKEGAEIIRNLAKEKGNKGIVAKLKQWLLDFWRELKGTFGTWNNGELSNLTLEQFNMMTVRDFTEGVPLNDITLSNGLTYTQSLSRTDNNIQMYIENGENENARALENAYVEHQKKVEAQVNNLLDSEAISATELRHVADQVAWLISDHITDLQTKEGYSEKLYGIKKEDLGSLSRADVVRHIGPQKIMDWCRDEWFDANNNNFDFDLDDILLLDEIKENWEGLMLLAQNTLLTIEDFSITTNPTTAESEVNTDLTANPDDFNSPQDTASIEENEGSQQEHWQVETKTLDVISTMSQQVKLALMRCLRLDADGNPIKSRLGINERINIREATNFILRNTQGALTLDAMVAKLSDKVKDNPWISQLVQRLSDKSGKETDFQSQFVSAFSKHFQSYSVVRLVTDETGKSHYESVTVNENPALSDAMKQITTQYKINEHPMFTSEGINRSTFEDLKTQINSLEKFSHTGYNVEDPALKEEAAKTLGYISNLFGYYVTPDMVAANLDAEQFKTMYSSLVYMRNSLEKNLNNRTYDPFNFKNKDSINGNLRNFLKPITMYFDDVSVASFYDSGKMYQSYTTPSYMSKLMAKLSETDPTKFKEFMHEEFGKYDWFRDQSQLDKTRGWRNNLIESLSRDPVTREKFKHKVQLNFNKHNYMKNMDDMEYTLSLITEFLAEYNPTGKRQWSWYRVPMQSNKPSSDFIRMERYNDANYQESIAENMQRIFSQELSRIQTVRLRNFSKEDLRYIKNLDKNGRKFCFLDFMNDYLEGSMKNSELGRLINDKLDGKKVNLDKLYTLSKNVILQKMTIRANEIVQNWENQGILDAAKKISNAGLTKDEIRENLINFVWNDTLAAMNIMELTITDIAYYRDAEELQKRLAQLHAPGNRGNVMATDYEGKLVSDGKERTFYLADFDNFVSNIVDNVSIVFDRKIDAARRRGATGEVKSLEALKDSLVRPRTYKEDGSIDDEGGAFWNINVADAQAYNSPTSYRKKAFIFGKWSRQAEAIYQKLRKGEYNYSDLKTAFQPLKPFVYSQIEKSTGVDGAPMRNLKMGVQNKNSEYLLIMADAMLQGENTGKPNLLRAIYNVMESSHYDEVTGEYKRDGIDTVQFVSAVKVGETGVLSLNEYLNDENGEAIAENVLKAHIYNTTTTINPETGEAVESREYNNNVVHAIPFEDYCLQQEVPQHFREHGDGQLHGSQLRYIVPSELADYNDAGEAVTYEVEGRKLSAKEFKAEYERTVAANIEDSINELSEMLELNKTGEDGGIDIVKRNTTLSKLLQKEILSSPRYGIDLYQACSVDENGKFRIPLGDPIQSKRVEQLINSIIKNHINKQKIAGGPAVQVSNFGTSRQLNIRFKDKNGGMLMTRDEWEKSTSSSKGNSFKEYIRQNQGGIAYFEVLAPIGATSLYANGLFEEFTDKNGAINIEAIEMLSPELLKMIGYRIPTEAKYSMAPLKIVGFLPREAGDGIMLPYDITLLTGSDFDVDKEYLMRKDYKINRTKISKSAMASLLYNELIDSQKKRGKLSYELKRKVNDLVQRFLSDPFDKASLVGTKTSDDFLGMTEGAYKKLLRTYVKNRYVLEDPADIKAQRNNKIVDMTYEVLTHETSAAEMLNPGGFDPQKRMGYMVSVARDTNTPWSQLQRMSTNELKDLANKNKNLMYIDTHIQFYRQNNAAGSLIGIFAVNRTAHAVIENEGYRLDVDGTLDFQDGDSFTVAGMEFAGLMPIDVRFDRSGESVGKVLGSLVASAADAVKDPVLNLMNINSNTANILTTLIRLGMPFNDAALFLSQSVISEALSTLSKQNIDGFSSLTKVVNEMIKKMEKDTGIDTSSPISKEELTRQELISGLKPGNDKVNYKVLQALSHFIKLADAMRMPTTATRFNSMSSAVGPLIVDNLMTEYKLNDLSSNSTIVDNNGDPIGIEDILEAHPILQQFARTLGIAQDLFGNMPANSTGFRNLLNSVVGTQVGKALMNDRRLMSKLSDFYQSYLVVAGNVVDSSRLEEVINNFPKEFIDGNYKERYRDNEFIQAIRFDTDKSGRPTLKVDTTGLDTGQKERLSSGWIDLHRVNPELSLKLFEYCFFRGGIGFNPKTFMNLVPVFIKERIPHYTETFERLPFTEASSIMDQFIRHNWNEKKLVRHIDTQKDKDHPFFINTIDGKTVILANEEIATSKYKLGVGDYVVIKNFNNSDRDILCKFTQHSEDIGPNLLMQEVDPLGDNGEFVEITVEGRENSIAPATVAMEDNAPSEVTQETETDGPQQDDVEITPEEEEELLYKIFMSQTRDRDAARAQVERHRSLSEADKRATERAVKTYMKNRFEALGLAFNEDKINRLYERMC